MAREMARKGSLCGTSIQYEKEHTSNSGPARRVSQRNSLNAMATLSISLSVTCTTPTEGCSNPMAHHLNSPWSNDRHYCPPTRSLSRSHKSFVSSRDTPYADKLKVHNRGTTELVVKTNGEVTGSIVDPQLNQRIGGFEGAHTFQSARFRASPGMSVDIPLLIGTACPNPDLGYTTPPGEWAFEVILNLDGRGRFRSPLLPVTVCPETEPWP